MKRFNFAALIGCSIISFTACKPQVSSSDTVKTTYTHKYGVEMEDEADWKSRGSSGEVVKKQKDGVVVKENYLNGLLHGKNTYTFPYSDVIQKELSFDNGVAVDETLYYVSGTPQQKTLFKADKALSVVHWYEDGVPRAEEEYLNGYLIKGDYFTPAHEVESQVKDRAGTRIVRDSMALLIARETIVDGDLVLQESYHNNKVPCARTPYVKGKIDGNRLTFFSNGDPRTVEEWKKGFLDGTMQVFQNGEVIAEVPYHEGKKNGVEKRLTHNGTLVVEEITWVADQKHGPSSRTIAGSTSTDWYLEGKKVSKSKYSEANAG